MAAVLNAFGAVASTSNITGPFNSASFTPTADDLLVIFAAASGTVAAAPTVTASANGLTFTPLSTVARSASGADSLYVFVADQLVPSSPVAMTVSFTAVGDAATGAIVGGARVTGMTKVGTAAIKQAAKTDNGASGTAPTATFGAAVDTANPTILFVINSTGAASMTTPASWTERVDVGYSSPTTGGGYFTRDSGFTGTTITLGATLASIWGAIAIELDASAATTTTLPLIHPAYRLLPILTR